MPEKKAPRELVVVTTQPPEKPAVALGTLPYPTLPLAEVVQQKGGRLRPLFGINPQRMRSRMLASPMASADVPYKLEHFYRVEADDSKLEGLAFELRQHPSVETAFVKPSAEPAALLNTMLPRAAEPPTETPDFSGRQLYLESAPGGVDARYAWTVAGGSGDGVSIIDIEGEWRFSHEDLTENQGGVVGGTPPNDIEWRNHGTAVLGEFSGDRNQFGITGICPNANVRAISVFNDGAAAAIRAAADILSAGDIILIELHYPGPRFNFQSPDGQRGYIPAEWWPDNLAAIQYATQRGILVVEAGGNGSENLDDPLYDVNPAPPQGPFPADWSNPFRRTAQDSGAILVGAGAPPQGTHGNDWGPDRSRLDFSNFGSMVDVQGWGREVTSCGYGDLQGGDNEDLWYTDQFSGTSSASPIAVGVLGCLQGVLRAAGQPLLTPISARALFRAGGSQQQEGPNGPVAQRIGSRPDLKSFIQQLVPSAPRVTASALTEASTETININLGGTRIARVVNINFGS